MAFMGIFILGWFAFMIFFIIICVILFVFIPCLIIFIINLVKGIKHKWPKRHLIPAIVTSVILTIIIVMAIGLLVLVLVIRSGATPVNESTASASIALRHFIGQIKY